MSKKRYHNCNIIWPKDGTNRIWSFSYKSRKPMLSAEHLTPADEPISQKQVRKDWRTLLKPSLNIAWLPPEEVFLRVVHLPTDDPSEVPDMLELQLEKLSPIPVGQTVWSYEIFPGGPDNLIAAVVVIVERKVVEEFLGDLEGRGFLTDRLVVPQLLRLKATQLSEDGVYIFPEPSSERRHCFVAWFFEGALQSVSFLHLDSGEHWPRAFNWEVKQMQWAGEIEGWLKSPPRFFLIADAEQESEWEPVLYGLGDSEAVPEKSMEAKALATYDALQANLDEREANLLPGDFAARYRQRFIDGLWMKAFGGILVLYLLFLAGYFGHVEYLKHQRDQLAGEIAAISGSYTNALKLNEQIGVLRRQEQLKFAALDCWKAVVEALPAGLNFDTFNFNVGNKLLLSGTAPRGADERVTGYREALENIQVRERPLFSSVVQKSRRDARGGTMIWQFECLLNESED